MQLAHTEKIRGSIPLAPTTAHLAQLVEAYVLGT